MIDETEGYVTLITLRCFVLCGVRYKYRSTPFRRSTPALSSGTLYCTRDMCPVKVHWHVKTNYKEYWRVKVTVTNRDFSKNFTNWNLVAQHPNFNNFTEAFSFKYKALNPYGTYSSESSLPFNSSALKL